MSKIEITSTQQVDSWLTGYGYETVEDMQDFYALKVDGWVGPITTAAMMTPRCASPDRQLAASAGGAQAVNIGSDCKWGKKSISYWNGNGGFSLFHKEMGRRRSRRLSREIIDLGFSMWADVVPFKFERKTGRFNARTTDLWVGGGRGRRHGFDGPGRTLAWAFMPCGNHGFLRSRFDMAEAWTNNIHKRANWIYALSVWVHELGHLLGLDHSKDKNDIMAPFYNPEIRTVQPGDAARLKRNYGITA